MTPDIPATPLTPERWQRMEAIFHAALQTSEPDQAEFLRTSCKGDDTLLTELRHLLVAFEDEKRFELPASATEPKGRLGETVGGYELDAELGQGGMGTVYLAHRADGEFEQQVALKVVSSHLRTQFFTERFRAERQILANLDHPNITRLLDGGVSRTGDPYLVMDYVEGQPLNRHCDQKLLTVQERIRLFLQACSAVEYAHRKLVVHRDLKPGNILVTKGGVPKLLDFGTAKLLLTTEAESTTTRFGAMTPRYASPEQLRGEPVSTSMDVYSLGVMLHELVAGAWPFGDPDSPIAWMERVVRDVEPATPRSLITDEAARLRSTSKAKLARVLDGDLRKILGKALEADPQRRYSSVTHLSEDLEHYLTGEPVRARPQTLPYRVKKFVSRNWLPATVAVAFVLGLSAATAIAIRQAQVARAQATRAEAVTRFLQDVIYAGEPEDVKDRTVLQAMEIARGRLNEVKDQPEVELSIRVALGYVYMANSLLPQAEKELRRAETLARQTDNKEMLASTLVTMANVLFDAPQVKARYMEALQLARAKDNRLSANLRMGILSEVGQSLGFEAHSPEVEGILREAVQVGRTNAVPKTNFVVALSRLAQYLRYENRIDEAEALLREGVGLLSSHPTVSSELALEELGAIRVERGDLEGGARYVQQRRDLLMRLAGAENGTTMDARSRWAALEARLGHVPEALQEMRDNMVHSRKAFAAGSLGLWHPLATLAYILNLAEQPTEALSLAKESLACLGPTTRSDLRLSQIEAEVGISFSKLHRDAEAIPYLEDSFRILSGYRGFGPNSSRAKRVREYLDQARPDLGH